MRAQVVRNDCHWYSRFVDTAVASSSPLLYASYANAAAAVLRTWDQHRDGHLVHGLHSPRGLRRRYQDSGRVARESNVPASEEVEESILAKEGS